MRPFVIGFLFSLILIIRSSQIDQSNTVFIGSITARDKDHFRAVFAKHLSELPSEAFIIYHAILGSHCLDVKVPNIDSICSTLNKPVTNAEESFYASSIYKLTGSSKCKVSTAEVETLSKQLLVEDIPIESLFYLISSMKNLDIKIDANRVSTILGKIKAKDTSPMTLSFMLHILSQLGLTKSALSGYSSSVGDVLDQAGEISDNQLFYIKGLYTSAFVAKSVVEFLTAYGEVPKGVENKLVKLFNYLYTRRQTTNIRASAYLVAAFKSLAYSSLLMPVVIESSVKTNEDLGLSIPPTFSVDRANPTLNLRLKDIWTDAYFKPSEFNLKADGLYAVKKVDEIRTLIGSSNRGNFKQDDKTNTFQLSLDLDANTTSGKYELEVTAALSSKKPNDNRKLLGITNVQIPLRVTTEAKVAQTTLTIMDTAHERHISDISLTPGKTYKASTPSGVITLELGQQISIDLSLVDSNQVPLMAHQVFVQLTHQKTQQAITFTCNEKTKDTKLGKKSYYLFLDPDASAAEFDYLSGVYKVDLIVGDSVIKNPILWHMFDVDLQFIGVAGEDTKRRITQATDISRQESSSPAGSKRASTPSAIIGFGPTSAKPEINHLFRTPEKRAPPFLALSFTILCLLPLLGLIIAVSPKQI
ncbi:Dolichyl-diphosphooligosaccharide--protein glycosyltransferase subunit 2 isoform 1 [Schistosoma japonicum]|uniref:Dolichyl-diphosphooligosaccharide--protein glycosyltransferase subunit 2 n=1 Tax=Schistosoma japonicum TaxID=6182 RepID=A0A4Z2D418_SCHJA|nr:Dolichyl-diphosphooligosaccharide--protein glycosyltransferase subunit 2 isoform 1 [Schistosoma japonicum]